MTSVRDASLDVLRENGMTTLFANPGSTEINLLTGLPDEFTFVLGLHEGSVVGMATGWAITHQEPPVVVLHTTAGLGNAVGALATARVNRAPLVVLVGQQDRRHLASQPFLAGSLTGLAGDYPVWTDQPVRAQDVPSALARARWEAIRWRGPALVVVPMDDWTQPADTERPLTAPRAVRDAAAAGSGEVAALAELLDNATDPALVVGAGADDRESWDALTALAERLDCPVWQEAFGGRAGFPQDHSLFAGFLPAERERLRKTLAGHDVVLTVGAGVFRQYPYSPGGFTEPGTTIAVLTDDPDEAHRSPVELAVIGPIAGACAALTDRVSARPSRRVPAERAVPPSPPAPDEPLRAAHVLAALAERATAETVVVEETPSSRPDLHALVPARAPMGFVSAAMGGLGFAMPAAVGIRMASPERPVVAVLGDGASLYAVQSLWSAARYRSGVLFVVLSNGGYAVMDRLAEQHGGGSAPWPGFGEVSISGLASSFGVPAREIRDYAGLAAVLDETVPTLAARREPLLLDIVVEPDTTFQP